MTEVQLAYDDPRRGGRAVILYDGRTGYGYEGLHGTALEGPLEQALAGTEDLAFVPLKHGDPAKLRPTWLWCGWVIRLIDGDGAPVFLDNRLYHSMYFVWDEFTWASEEEPDLRSMPEMELAGLAPSEEVHHMLVHLTRVAAGRYSHGPSGGLRRTMGYKDRVFNLVPRDSWQPLPGYGPSTA